MKILLKLLRIFAIIVVSIVLLNIILFITLSIPFVQNKAKNFALSKVSPIINTEASIGKIHLQLLNSVRIRDLYVEDQNQDTLLYVGKLDVKFNPLGLLNNKLQFYAINLEDFTANIYKETPDTTFNFQFLIDAFASKDTLPKEPNPNPLKLNFDNVNLKNGIAHYHVCSEPISPGVFNSNHIDVYDLNAVLKAPSIDINNLDATIKVLTLKEQSGLILHHLKSSKVTSKDGHLTADKLSIKTNTTEINLADIVYNLNTQEFAVDLKSEEINPADVSVFLPQFDHLDKSLALDVSVHGQLPQIEVSKLILKYGTSTFVNFDGHIADYTKYDDADLLLNLKELRTTQSDLDAFVKIGNKEMTLPNQVIALGDLNLKLIAKGPLKRFDVNGLFKTAPGNIKITGVGKVLKPFSDFIFDGRVATKELNTASILGDSLGLDLVSVDINANVKQREGKPISVVADGEIFSLIYKKHDYNNIVFSGSYIDNNIKATVKSATQQDNFNLHAEMFIVDSLDIKVNGVVDKMVLEPFFTLKDWKNASLTARIDGEFTGKTIDDIQGTLVLDSLSLVEESFIFNPGAIYLQSLHEGGEKRIRLFSNFLEAEIWGDYYFTSIAQEMKQLLQPHLPSLIEEEKEQIGCKNNFQFALTIKNTEDLSHALYLPFYNAEPGTITGKVNMLEHQSKLQLDIPRLMFGKNDVRQTKMNLSMTDIDGIDLDLNSYLVYDSGYINGELDTKVYKDSVLNSFSFDMNTDIVKTNGELNASIGFERDEEEALATNITIHPTTLIFNDNDINLKRSLVRYTAESIKVNNFGIVHEGKQQFGIDGVASKNVNDSLRVFFDGAELANILPAFKVENIYGTIDGNIMVRQALNNPIVYSDHFKILNIRTDKDSIGTLFVEALYSPDKEGLNLDVYISKDGIRHTGITGFVPANSEEEMDLVVMIEKLPLRWIQPFAISTFSKLEGTLSTKMDVGGKTSAPIIEGWLGVNDGLLKVDFTNVEYRISDTIRVNRDNFGFENLVILDEKNNTAKIGLVVNHSDNFGRLDYSASIKLNDFLLLNNPTRTDLMAHGVLKLDGDIVLNGSPTGLFGTANISTSSRSNVKIELPQTASASKYDGIVYINTTQDDDPLAFIKKRANSSNKKHSSSGMLIDIQATVDLTPLLELAVQYNPKTGDMVSISGTGELGVNYNTKSDPQIRLYGEYIAKKGEAGYNIPGIKRINFKVKEGSKINFLGDPLKTSFDLIAYHQVKADLSSLNQSFTQDANVSNTRVPVNALLEISGDLDGMEIRYDVELPEASQDVQRKVKSLISTEEERIKQFANLVAFNRFYGSSNMGQDNFGSEMFTNVAAGALLTKGLDALFASALNDNWSISTNLESYNGTFDDVRMGVDVSTRLFDDKLEVSTNLSYGDDKMNRYQQDFIAEFDVRYRLLSWLKLRAFNKANERYYKLAPTTQGVGLEVNKEAETLKELFKFRFFPQNRKRKLIKEEVKTPDTTE